MGRPLHHPWSVPRSRGFTLIELMVTVALLALLGTLAAPSLRSFVVRNNLSSLGTEFTGSLLRARNEAVTKNICTTMCLSDTVDAAVPFCKQSGNDWQAGWMVFLNPSCDAGYGKNATTQAVAAADLVLVRKTGSSDYMLTTDTGKRRIQFNARGNSGMGSMEMYELDYVDHALALKLGFNICLDKMGRTRSISASATCSD